MIPAQSFHDKAKAKLADRDAYAMTEPGDVVVIDGGGRGDISAMGGLSTLMAKKYISPPLIGTEFAPTETLDKALGFYLRS